MRSSKGSHRILVRGVEYRWRATGNDGYISIGIWPSNNLGPFIRGTIGYHETCGDQIIVTNKIIRRIIDQAIVQHQYDPRVNGKELNLKVLEEMIKWDDAVRATKDKKAIEK